LECGVFGGDKASTATGLKQAPTSAKTHAGPNILAPISILFVSTAATIDSVRAPERLLGLVCYDFSQQQQQQ
jgi:hypothetical protein